MNFEIHSHYGAGPIRFGMSPSEVRGALGASFKSFKRTPQSAHPCDFFPDLYCFVYYDSTGKAEALEFAEPAQPMLDGVNLLGVGFADLVEQLGARDEQITVESDGFTALGLGVGAYAPAAEDDSSAFPESVIVFAPGYYN